MTDAKAEAEPEALPAPAEQEAPPPPAPKLYKLVTVNGETKLDELATDALNFSELHAHVEAMAGVTPLPFHVVKIPEEGKPTVSLCETAADLSKAMSELTAGEAGTIMVFRGERVDIGHQRTIVPLTIGDEAITEVAVQQPDPPEDKPPAEAEQPAEDKPAEDTPDEPDQPAEDAPAEG